MHVGLLHQRRVLSVGDLSRRAGMQRAGECRAVRPGPDTDTNTDTDTDTDRDADPTGQRGLVLDQHAVSVWPLRE